jgi:DNA-binding beta-propeller fold protein YncE
LTTTQQQTQGLIASAEYPTLLRMGHKYECCVGQRLPVGGFYGPIDMAVGSDGWLYVLNRFENVMVPRNRYVTVTLKDEYGEFVSPTVNGQPDEPGNEMFPSPSMCTIDSQGVLYSTDEHANKVLMMRTSGETIGWWGEAGNAPGQLNAPCGITVDADENVWVVSSRSHKVQRFTRDGKYLSGWGEFGTEPGQLNFPWGIAIDPVNGSVLVADWRNDRVQRFTPEGELLQIIGRPGDGEGELRRPSGVAVDMHGDVYVVDRGHDLVLVYNHRGMFIESFRGDATMTERGADKLLTNPDALRLRDNVINLDKEKRFYHPTSVKLDNEGRVYVVDTGRFRVQVYQKLWRILQPNEIDPPDMHVDPVVY